MRLSLTYLMSTSFCMYAVCEWLESNPIELGDGGGGTTSFPFTSSLTNALEQTESKAIFKRPQLETFALLCSALVVVLSGQFGRTISVM